MNGIVMTMKNTIYPLLGAAALVVSCWPAPAATPATNDLQQLISEVSTYHSGQSLESLRQLEATVRAALHDPALRASVEAGLVELLSPEASYEARSFAAKQLAFIGSEKALPAMGQLLEDSQTVGLACLALTTYPPGKADSLLRQALANARGAARVQILNTLGNRRDARSTRLFKKAAADADPAVFEAGAAALGKLGTRRAWSTLEPLRRKARGAANQTLLEAMLVCADRLAASDPKSAVRAYTSLLAPHEPRFARRAALAALLRLEPEAAGKRINATLAGSDRDLKPVAIAAVATLPSPQASTEFGSAFGMLGDGEKVWLIESLATRADAGAKAAIAGQLAATNLDVRIAAIGALGDIGGADTVAVLAGRLSETQEADELKAIENALIALGGGGATDQALQAFFPGLSGGSRALLLSVLARRQGSGANPLLLQEMRSAEAAVSRAAFRALARTGTEQEVPALLAALEAQLASPVRLEAETATAQVLTRLADRAAACGRVREALEKSKVTEVQSSLLGLLPTCGDSASLDLAKKAAANPDPAIRDAAVRALSEWPNLEAWDPLFAAYRDSTEPALRVALLRGLVRLAAEEHAKPAVADRYRALTDQAKGDGELKLILGSLGGAGHPETLQLALAFLSREGVRAEAEVAVRKIAEAIKPKHPEAARDALAKLPPKT